MKKLIFGAIALLGCLMPAGAQDEGTIDLSIITAEQTEDVPDATIDFMNTRLTQIATADGITRDPLLSQFFLAGKFNHIVEDIVPGPPRQTALHTQLTLYIGDLSSHTTYASVTLELRGVGTSDQRAFINAMQTVNAKNPQIKDFLTKGRKKVLDYYNTHYRQILAQAERAASQHKYDEALWRLVSVPECCTGYSTVKTYIDRYYKKYIDQEGVRLLNAAKAAWGVHPDQTGAADAYSYLMQIDPESASYPAATALANEMRQSIKSDRDFELRKKYQDQIDLEKSRIEGARAVGVAFGNGQQPVTTNITWLR